MLIWGALLLLACFSVAVSTYGLHSRKYIQQLREQLNNLQQAQAQELASVNQAAMGVGRRLLTLEKRLNQLSDNEQQVLCGDYRNAGQAVSINRSDFGAMMNDLAAGTDELDDQSPVDEAPLSESEEKLYRMVRGEQ